MRDIRLNLRIAAMAVAFAFVVACQSSTTTSSTVANTNQTLTVGTVTDFAATGFDPHSTSNLGARRLSLALFDTLVAKSYNDPSKPLAIVPGLATSWDISGDGKTYTFHLRSGVKFTDGTVFDAPAAVFNLQTLLDPTFQYYDKKGDINSKFWTTYIDTYRALDPHTLQVVLKAPFGGLLDTWSLPNTDTIISPAAIQKYGIDGITSSHPVGTGPFQLVSYTAGQAVVLQRNDSYWRGPAAFKTLVLRPITDPAARAVALQAGEIQIAESISIQYKAQWTGRSDISLQTSLTPNPYVCYLNDRSGPTTKFEFRKALNLAVNRQQINQLVLGNLSSIPNGFYSPASAAYASGDPPLTYDPTGAAAAIQQLGLKGTTLVFETRPTLGDPAVWDVLAQNFRDVGLNPVQKVADTATWVGDFLHGMPSGQNMLCGLGGSDELLSFYTLIAREAAPDQLGLGNPAYYSNPKSDAAFSQARSSHSPQEFVADMRSASQAVTADFGMLFIIYNVDGTGLSSNVKWQSPVAQAHSFYYAKYTK
jgi:peptide/nickel transport system substrate-binding protein